MFKMHQVFSLIALSALGVALVGCSTEPAPAPPAAAPTDAATDVASPSDVPEGFAELSDADRALALAQRICPVSGDELGGMGTPIKVSVSGRDVFICCESCREPLMNEPDKYLAKLDAK